MIEKHLSIINHQWCSQYMKILQKIMWLMRMSENKYRHINFMTTLSGCSVITTDYLAEYLEWDENKLKQFAHDNIGNSNIFIPKIDKLLPIIKPVIKFELLSDDEQTELYENGFLKEIVLQNEKGYYINSDIEDRLWYNLFYWLFGYAGCD